MKTGDPSSSLKYTKLINSKMSTAKERWKRNLKRGEKDKKYKKKKSHKKLTKSWIWYLLYNGSAT